MSVSQAKNSVMVQVETTKEKKERRKTVISVGIDISKDKITVCALEEGSKIIWKPFNVYLNKSKVEELIE